MEALQTIVRDSAFPLFKIFVPLPPLFCSTPFYGVSDSSPILTHSTPSYPNPTDQPSLHIINELRQISKGWFYQFNCCFLSKNNFWFFQQQQQQQKNQVILIYGIFSSSILDNFETLFFIKLWCQKEIIFLQMYNTILQRVK